MAVLWGIQDWHSPSQVILRSFSQPVGWLGLAKALRTSGVQDFLRLRSKSCSTWDHPLWKNLDHHQPGKWKDKIFFLNCPDPGPATAETVPVRLGLGRFAEAGRHSLTAGAGLLYLGHL